MLKLKKPDDIGIAFVYCCNAYLNAIGNPNHPSWPEIRYFESLGWRFDRQHAPYLLDGQHRYAAMTEASGWGHASARVPQENGVLAYQNTWDNTLGPPILYDPEWLESLEAASEHLENMMRVGEPGFMRWEPQSSVAGLEAAFPPPADPPYTRREYNPEFVINDLPDRNQLGEAANYAIQAAGRRMAEQVEERVMITYADLRMNGEPIAFTQDNRGHVRFAEPVTVTDGDQLRITYTVTLDDEELPDI